jgi:H+/Cl- antiporter ClcA
MASYQYYYWNFSRFGICRFLISLNWATDFRENHIWLIALLPIGGFLIGLLYHYYGKDVEAGIIF